MKAHQNIWLTLPLGGIFLMSSVALADSNGGSGYSRYGIGDLRYFISSRSVAIGGSGIALLSVDAVNRLNPAAWVRINRTRFSVGALYEGFSTTDDAQSAYLSGMTFNGFAIAFPVSPRYGIVVSGGITPFSRINYNVTVPGSQGGLLYNVQYIGDGGLSVGHVGSSGTLFGDLHLGAKLNYYFGTLRYTTKQSFGSTAFTSADVARSIEMRGIGASFGLAYSGLKNVLNLPQAHSLTIGFVFSPATYLTTSEVRLYTYNTTAVTARDTIASPDGKSRLPFSFGGGISYSTERLVFTGDAYYQNWERFTLNGVALPELRNSFRASAGAELIPKRESGAPFTQRIAYRLGAFYNASYYRLRGEPINEIGVTGGFGIPIIGDTRLDISAEYSFRGTTDKQLQKDRILRVSFTLSGSELWFVRPTEE